MARKLSKNKAQRISSGLNQQHFWKLFGVTQSGGSRYENGRDEPTPVKLLKKLAFGSVAEATKIFQNLRNLGKRVKQ